jgi:hypothetical protein
MDTTKSTSRRQGRLREERAEGSRSANVRNDEQKPHIRLSSWASRHNTNEAHRFGSRVNAAFVHGKFTFLSGEICVLCDRRFMSNCRNRFTRLIKYPAHLSAVDRCDSLLRETRNRQQLMIIFYSALRGNTAGKHTEVSRRHSTSNTSEGRPERGNEDDTAMSSHTAMTPTG